MLTSSLMSTRRQFVQSAAMAGLSTILPASATKRFDKPAMDATKPYSSRTPMLQLQQQFMDLRFGMFVHFNMATFQDREWGDPNGPTEAFDPTDLDTDQWADAALSAGMGYGCLTTRHHDGFCLWPTKTKAASILQTPKKLDVVKRYTDSFRQKGLKVGLYYSILSLRDDIRHFNITPAKIQLIHEQLTELLTQYGKIDLLIFDGWDAPWSRIPYSEVPFDDIYRLIKSHQPDCLISELNASQYPETGLYYSDIKAYEQNAGQEAPSDSAIPAQACVTLTEGWFWKLADSNRPLKTVDQVVNQWLVPHNQHHCNLILNAPPDRTGRLAENVVSRLKEIGKAWQNPGPAAKLDDNVIITTPNLATGQTIHANSYPDTVGPDLANDGKFDSDWYPDFGLTSGWLQLTFKHPTLFNVVGIVEPVGQYQDYEKSRIGSYRFEAKIDGAWQEIAGGQVPHRVQFHRTEPIKTDQVRFSFEASADTPHISEIGIYNEP